MFKTQLAPLRRAAHRRLQSARAAAAAAETAAEGTQWYVLDPTPGQLGYGYGTGGGALTMLAAETSSASVLSAVAIVEAPHPPRFGVGGDGHAELGERA